ncbi:hypothetical protein BGX28_003237 [Mortierella sp. GBA30]|nr:hypothetical protein BGX28_003237 [Mortierella sp. GBA30]
MSSTIKAAIFEKVNPISPFLSIKKTPAPTAGKGGVVVRVLAARVSSSAKEVFNGTRIFPMPIVPGTGGVGIIKSIGPGTAHLEVGQLVFISPTILENVTTIPPSVQENFTPDQLSSLANLAFIKAAGEGFEIDIAFDILPPAGSSSYARSAIMALRARGERRF